MDNNTNVKEEKRPASYSSSVDESDVKKTRTKRQRHHEEDSKDSFYHYHQHHHCFVYTDKTDLADIPKSTLTYLRVDDSVKTIPSSAFSRCRKLIQVELPDNLERVGACAFQRCFDLKRVYFFRSSSSSNSAPKDKTTMITEDENLKDGVLVFPSNNKNRLVIGDYAFSNCRSLQIVKIPSPWTVMFQHGGAGAGFFSNCQNLTTVELPPGIQAIARSCFQSCHSLTTIHIPSTVIVIGSRAFSECRSLSTLQLPPGLLSIGEMAFSNCHSMEADATMVDYCIPSSVSTIGASAFENCYSLKRIVLPAALVIISRHIFRRCTLLEFVYIPDNVKEIGHSSFGGCVHLKHIRIPSSVARMKNSAFQNCDRLISMELPEELPFNFAPLHIVGCCSLVNLAIPSHLVWMPRAGEGNSLILYRLKKFASVVDDDFDDLVNKLKHRFDNAPLHKLCYYQSYYPVAEAMQKLRILMDDDVDGPSAKRVKQVDSFGMTPLHILLLAQSPNLRLLHALMDNVVHEADHIIRTSRDSFGATPMDYLCLSRSPDAIRFLRALLQKTVVQFAGKWLGLERWRSDVMQSVDKALSVVDSLYMSRRREIGLVYYRVALYERMEILSLVELFLWKLKLDDVAENADRKSCRINSGASIVIPNVMLFLEQVGMEDYLGANTDTGPAWCPNRGKCRTDAAFCQTGGGNGGGGGGNGNAGGNGGGGGNGNAGGNGGGNGNSGGNGGVSNGRCNAVKTEDLCTTTGCFFCADEGKCRASEMQCRGKGRFNPCQNKAEAECSSSELCSWCSETSMCTGARGARCPSTSNRGNPCKDLVDEDSCTSSTATCRWCPVESVCKRGNAGCDDGSSGIRGNPCKEALTTNGCSAIEGCLWCEENSKCKKDVDGCDEDADDDETPCRAQDTADTCSAVEGCGWCENWDSCRRESVGCDVEESFVKNKFCRRLEFQVDCDEETDICQWCSQQEKCRPVEASCDARSEEVELDIEYDKARFAVRNDGLGNADPNEVSGAIKYLFEIAEDGETVVGSSFIDLENQEFKVEQVQAPFFGGLLARKVSFEASVPDVGSIEIEVFFSLESGSITTPSGETVELNEGGMVRMHLFVYEIYFYVVSNILRLLAVGAFTDIKFNINIDNWSFCDPDSNPCGDGTETSQFIDVAAEILGSENVPEADGSDPMVYNLGGGVPLVLSNQVEVDGQTATMPPGFPRVESSDQGTVFVFRFPRFQSTLEYDPIVKTQALTTGSDSGGSIPCGLSFTAGIVLSTALFLVSIVLF
eukprot:scaffold1389_cov122-Cylindrotheca_fusiformis.AAC.4